MKKYVMLFIILLMIISFASCTKNKTNDSIDSTNFYTVSETEPATEPNTTAPETTAPETTMPETTEPETTVLPETILVLEYEVVGGEVWTFEEEEPPEQEAVLVTAFIEDFAYPQEDGSYKTEDGKHYDVIETRPAEPEVVPPSRDNYTPDGLYSPIAFMYHSISEEPFTNLTDLFVRPSEFEEHLKAINAAGYEYRFADEFTASDTPSVILTFDDGYVDNYTEMFPLLKKYNAKATIFMVGTKVGLPGFLSIEQIREMVDSGLVRIGSHTHNHYSLTSLPEESLKYEFRQSKEYLESVAGHVINSVCYPGGRVTDHIAELAENYYTFGYTTVSSPNTYGADPMLLPRVRVSRGMTGAGFAGYLR